MRLEQLVLPGDLTDAAREHACMTQCLFLAWRAAKYGQFELADQLVKDARKSRVELDRLMKYKEERKMVGEWLTKEAIKSYEKQMHEVKKHG